MVEFLERKNKWFTFLLSCQVAFQQHNPYGGTLHQSFFKSVKKSIVYGEMIKIPLSLIKNFGFELLKERTS